MQDWQLPHSDPVSVATGLLDAVSRHDQNYIDKHVDLSGQAIAFIHRSGRVDLKRASLYDYVRSDPEAPPFVETLSLSSAVIQGPFATVSGTYVYAVHTLTEHCGDISISLFNTQGTWKINQVQWTVHWQGCQ